MLRDCLSKENLDSAMELRGKIPTGFTEPEKTKLRQREAGKAWHCPFPFEFTLLSVRKRTGTVLSAGRIPGINPEGSQSTSRKLRMRGGTSRTRQGSSRGNSEPGTGEGPALCDVSPQDTQLFIPLIPYPGKTLWP